ncbi:MAG: redoxin domain-containing protein [Phycisphaeraceae bacterium]|nr:redoxin domain-containing protein [Phycisphaerae bacterium]MBX3391155.1 redoxin domain-containing protein [Phycisphaeraceae bacterium]HRJ49603.1 redoxin domain-containing protein [Phycisphaerales bacterium]
MNARSLFSMFAVGMMAMTVAVSGTAVAQQPASQPTKEPKQEYKDKDHKDQKRDKHDDKKAASATIGSMAPDFELKDTDGKSYKLSDLTAAGNIVVLEWFNPDCPVVKMHYDAKTSQGIAKKYKDKKVVYLAINSGAAGKQGAGVERNAKARKDWSLDFPILLDEKGDVGRMYGARNTPALSIITKDGILAYRGAIDDGSSESAGKVNYVAKALDEILAGSKVSTPETKAYGCSVKY